jgi:hypothetical protein
VNQGQDRPFRLAPSLELASKSLPVNCVRTGGTVLPSTSKHLSDRGARHSDMLRGGASPSVSDAEARGSGL